jgi:hypothetical protein
MRRRMRRVSGCVYAAPQTGQKRAFVSAGSSQLGQMRRRGERSLGGGYEWNPAPGW